MKRFGICSLLLCICLSQGIAAMGNPPQQPSFVSRLAHWGSSALKQVKTGAKSAVIFTGVITGLSKLFTGSARPRLGASLSSSMACVNQFMMLPVAGQYVYDEDNNRQCYLAEDPQRFNQILEATVDDPDAEGPGYDWKYAGRFMARNFAQTALLRGAVMPVATMLPFFPHIGALMSCAYAKPGFVGLAATFGVNTACIFATMMAMNYIVIPTVDRGIRLGKHAWQRYRGTGPIA